MNNILCINKKYEEFYTYDKNTKKVFDKDILLEESHIIYKILEKYKNMLSYLENIKIIKNTTIEEADNNLVYKGLDKDKREQYCYGINYVLNRKKKKLNNFLKVYNNIDKIQDIIDHGLKDKNISKDFVFSVLLIMELTYFIRLGKDIYFEQYGTIGLLCLQRKHFKINKDEIEISFKGKTGKEQFFICKELINPVLYNSLLRLLRNLKDDDFVFSFYKADNKKQFTEKMLNSQLKKLNITLKDFRTYGVNMVFIKQFYNNLILDKNFSLDKNINNINKLITKSIKNTAETIGHTTGISKKSYLVDEIGEIIQIILKNNKITSFEIFLKKIISKLKDNNGEKK